MFFSGESCTTHSTVALLCPSFPVWSNDKNSKSFFQCMMVYKLLVYFFWLDIYRYFCQYTSWTCTLFVWRFWIVQNCSCKVCNSRQSIRCDIFITYIDSVFCTNNGIVLKYNLTIKTKTTELFNYTKIWWLGLHKESIFK